jgi:hypothetical protein
MSVRLDQNFITAFSNEEKASLFAACLQKQKEAFQPFGDDALLEDRLNVLPTGA